MDWMRHVFDDLRGHHHGLNRIVSHNHRFIVVGFDDFGISVQVRGLIVLEIRVIPSEFTNVFLQQLCISRRLHSGNDILCQRFRNLMLIQQALDRFGKFGELVQQLQLIGISASVVFFDQLRFQLTDQLLVQQIKLVVNRVYMELRQQFAVFIGPIFLGVLHDHDIFHAQHRTVHGTHFKSILDGTSKRRANHHTLDRLQLFMLWFFIYLWLKG
mmetsp:Transcript_2372/g.3855  ORF Transcript_2372/g.3855 Transcript_2372/m.3855 type:complete len:214 (+) Transcript_2372:927-1568(+)